MHGQASREKSARALRSGDLILWHDDDGFRGGCLEGLKRGVLAQDIEEGFHACPCERHVQARSGSQIRIYIGGNEAVQEVGRMDW